MITSLKEFVQAVNAASIKSGKGDPELIHGGPVLGIDPGETTGYCLMHNYEIVIMGQLETKTLPGAVQRLTDLFANISQRGLVDVACEDYRVYSWKSDDHKWSAVHTVKVVGQVQALAYQYKWPISLRMAQNPKSFVTDDKLKKWGLYSRGEKHARDALRHAIYHIVFRKPEVTPKA